MIKACSKETFFAVQPGLFMRKAAHPDDRCQTNPSSTKHL
jgi:hypothetical protein